MNNCLTEFTGKENIIKIDMDLPYEENYPVEATDALNKLLSYFITKQKDMNNGFYTQYRKPLSDSIGNVVSFSAQYCDNFSRAHIQVGGINGNNTISIRKMTDMSEEKMDALTDKMDLIVKDYLRSSSPSNR
jgi:hypothetical protein